MVIYPGGLINLNINSIFFSLTSLDSNQLIFSKKQNKGKLHLGTDY